MTMDVLSSAFSLTERAYRARRIGLTFGRIYLGIKSQQLIARVLAPANMERRWSRFHRESADSIYGTATELRGMILKGCQFIGARADIVPPEYSQILGKLQDRVPHHPFDVVQEIIEDELERPMREVFESFSHEPIAAASLAQVHEARLLDGERVAVKVQYPEIAKLVRSDLANLRALFKAVGIVEREVELMPLVEELGSHIPLELDFVNEADNAERFSRHFADRPEVATPRIRRELSTSRVLVMEFIDGVKIDDRDALVSAGVDPAEVMRILVDVYVDQILHWGFFHADPHPGNLLVQPNANGDGPRLVMLDFGLAKQLPPGFRAGCVDFMVGLMKKDRDAMAEALVALGFVTRDPGLESLREITRILLEAADTLRSQPRGDPDALRRKGREIARQVRQNPIVQMPSHIVLLGRVLGLLSGLSHRLEAKIDWTAALLPVILGGAANDSS